MLQYEYSPWHAVALSASETPHHYRQQTLIAILIRLILNQQSSGTADYQNHHFSAGNPVKAHRSVDATVEDGQGMSRTTYLGGGRRRLSNDLHMFLALEDEYIF